MDAQREEFSQQVPSFLLAALLFAFASIWARFAGFDCISDDDYARVVLAQSFARSPALDPTGTSWLPAPFWIYGSFMRALGSSLFVAYSIAIFAAAFSGVLLIFAATFVGIGRRGALFCVALSLLLPLVPLLGAAPVPELPVAASIVFGLLLLASPQAPLRVWFLASVLLFLATLSRYEAWVPSLIFSLSALSHTRYRPWLLLAAFLASIGPILWILWNFHSYGHPFAFAHRVAAYREGLGIFHGYWWNYPGALLREAPVALLLGGVLGWRIRKMRWPLVGVTAQVFALMFAELRGGAPTHHPERALLGPMLVLVVISVLVVQREFIKMRGKWWWLLIGSVIIGYWRWKPTVMGLGVPRREEVALGAALREPLALRGHVLFIADSYGFFAIQSAMVDQHRLEVIVPKKVDPRSKIEEDLLRDASTLGTIWAKYPGVWGLLVKDEQASWLPHFSEEIPLPGARIIPREALVLLNKHEL